MYRHLAIKISRFCVLLLRAFHALNQNILTNNLFRPRLNQRFLNDAIIKHARLNPVYLVDNMSITANDENIPDQSY